MFQRTSIVDMIHTKIVSFSSSLQIGDTNCIQGFSRALAVQREKDLFFGNEGHFHSYPIFTRDIPVAPIYENITMQTQNLKPIIKVNNIRIIAVSFSSVFQIGNSNSINMESRVKHIRHLLNSDYLDDSLKLGVRLIEKEDNECQP